MFASFNRLVSYGPSLVDLINHVDRIPPSGGDAYISESRTMAGGSFNTESAAARLGLRTIFAGTVGTGNFADILLSSLRAEGIDFLGRQIADVDTGFCFTMVEPSAERAFVTLVGAESQLTLDQLDSVALSETDFVYLSGYQFVTAESATALKQWLLMDKLNGAAIVFDPASVIDQIDEEYLELMREKSFLISCNAREFDIFKPAVKDKARYLRRDGENPVKLFEAGRQIMSVPAYPVKQAKDTTGAGDVHCGALMAGLSQGQSWQEAIELANRAAAYCVTKTGGSWGPSREILTSL